MGTKHGFIIVESKQIHLTELQAKEFYEEHAQRSFYMDLVKYMISGPVLAMKLKKPNAIKEWRQLIGNTDPKKARQTHPNSIRALYGTNIQNNAVHGSESKESALREINFFFSSE